MTGYFHGGYAQSLGEFGRPRLLPCSQGWILERDIPGTYYRDAMGVYPLFCCRDWGKLAQDLVELEGLVSLVLVTDPLGAYSLPDLTCFDRVSLFKEHYVVDLADVQVSEHHRRNVRKALPKVQVEHSEEPIDWLADWIELYRALVERHDIKGIARFSSPSFEEQFRVPGLVAFRATHDGHTVAMLLWYVMGDKAYYHLGASSPLGYELKASFALFQASISFFEPSLRWLSLGAGAGSDDCSSGLTRFKQGWTEKTRPAYLCGWIFDYAAYRQLVGSTGGDYFPAYRRWEG